MLFIIIAIAALLIIIVLQIEENEYLNIFKINKKIKQQMKMGGLEFFFSYGNQKKKKNDDRFIITFFSFSFFFNKTVSDLSARCTRFYFFFWLNISHILTEEETIIE